MKSPEREWRVQLRERYVWLRDADHPVAVVTRQAVGVLVVVAVTGLVLYAVSGVWPPMVAVKSGSMAPHLVRGDLVVTMNEHRFAPDNGVEMTGVVTTRAGRRAGYRSFGAYGDVIVYKPRGGDDTPIIHRARFWVNESENWYAKANSSFVSGESCASVPNCPAPHAGFITKGDAVEAYDQVNGLTGPVRPSWVRGTAEVGIPLLGHLRLLI